MNDEPRAKAERKDAITRNEHRLVALWALSILLVYAVCAYLGGRALRGYKAETAERRRAFLRAETIDGSQAPEMGGLEKAAEVSVGVYVNGIGELSTKDGAWTEDFDVWFRWQDAPIDPGATFQILNGEIGQREKIESYAGGGEHYERYRVRARLTGPYDPGRYPFGDEALTIGVEDGTRGVARVRYVADERNSGVNRRGLPQNMTITRSLATVKYYAHESTLGDPRATADTRQVHSLLVFVTIVSPPSWPVYVKNLQALFASVAVAFIVFFIKPTHVDPRFGLCVGAVFTATANNIMVGAYIPATDRFTLTAMINAAGLLTIFLTLVESAISLYLLDTLGRERLYRWFDRVSFVTLLVGYASLNVILPLSAA